MGDCGIGPAPRSLTASPPLFLLLFGALSGCMRVGLTTSRSATAEIACTATPVLLYAAEANINDPGATQSPDWLTTSALNTSCGGSPGNAQTHGTLLLGSSADPVSYAPTLTSPERWVLALIAYRPE